MYKIDAHQHFWKFDPVRDSWIDDEMEAIRRDFLPPDLMHILMHNHIDGCIAVQASQSEKENQFLLEQAGQYPFIKGIVGWVDLQSPNVAQQLEQYSQNKKIKGFRHVLQGEPQRDFMLRKEFLNGISHLKKHGFTYDILVFPDQLEYTAQFVAQFPDQPFVIDHIAKPDIKNQQIDEWAANIRRVAQYGNVHCKVSGMVTEANWYGWEEEDFKPYMDVIFEAFGVERLMFGSDWPVCMVAGGYNRVVKMVRYYTEQLTDAEKDAFWGGNAIKFYKLDGF
jgi:L-fuconolactonase